MLKSDHKEVIGRWIRWIERRTCCQEGRLALSQITGVGCTVVVIKSGCPCVVIFLTHSLAPRWQQEVLAGALCTDILACRTMSQNKQPSSSMTWSRAFCYNNGKWMNEGLKRKQRGRMRSRWAKNEKALKTDDVGDSERPLQGHCMSARVTWKITYKSSEPSNAGSH